MKPYQTEGRTHIMNIYSFLGDGEIYFLMNLIPYALDYRYEFTFLTISYIMSLNWVTFLKTMLRHSRPQFDDPSIGVANSTVSSVCSGEFGNPSGHTLLTTSYLLVAWLFLKQVCANSYKKNRWCGARLFDTFVFSSIFMVSLCRLYLGRHSLDQIILGNGLGAWSAIFAADIYKKYFYDPVFAPDVSKDSLETIATRSWQSMKNAIALYCAIFVAMVGLFTYVDIYQQIPDQWMQSLIDTCPTLRKSHTFHYFSLAATGYITVIPSFYIFNYLKHAQWARDGLPIATARPPTWVIVVEAIIKLCLMQGAETMSKKVPAYVYGTNDLEPLVVFGEKSF